VDVPITVAESPQFIARADRILGEEGREQLVEFSCRESRSGCDRPWDRRCVKTALDRAGERGKRGGTRVIYYFHSEGIPLFALDIYAKNEKADLKADEKTAWKAVVHNIVKNYRSIQ
jgi:mRNA-degrading endonuclease RelE of RelBE toxin-antitoxin system